MRLLLVEEREAAAALILAELRRAGFDPVCTRVETEAAYLSALDPTLDIILAGDRRSVLDASQALHHLRASGLDVPLIVVSPPIPGERAAALMKAGLADYVSTEGLGRLGPAVREACDARRHRRAYRDNAMTGDTAEATRRQMDGAFRLLFNNNPLPMWVYDRATLQFLEVNIAAVEHYGYSRQEFLGMRLPDIRPHEDVARLEQALTELAHAPRGAIQRYQRTWRHRLRDGRIRDVDIASHPIEFTGRPATLVVAIDVTELKQAQALVARSSERLRILHEIDRALIAAEAPVAIAEAALWPLRDLLGVARAIVNLFDLEAGEAEWLAAVGRRRSHVGRGVRFPMKFMGDIQALRRGERQVIDVRVLLPSPHAEALLASGVETFMVVPMIAGGELIGALSFGGATAEFPPEQLDIATEAAAQLAIVLTQARLRERVKRQAGELEERVRERTLELSIANEQLEHEIAERRHAEEEADRANRAKSEFLSRMSHELRTPLNGILGFAQLLELDARDEAERESVDHILKGGRHLLMLIDEILDIARIEVGKLRISVEPVLVADVVRTALDLVRPQAAARGVTLSDGASECDRYVTADRQRLQQVLLNLLSNAVKYNRDGGAVGVSCEEHPGRRVRLHVRDTGAGIAPALLPRLFTPFDRLGAEQSDVEGTGLGLVLSKRLVEAMDGRLLVDSRPGEGTTFTVELLGTDAAAAEASTGAGAPSEADPSQTRGTILYVEDNLANLRLLERIIARRPGVRLLSAMQGTRGLELARAHRPDLVLLDLHLPDLPGDEVLARLQSDPVTRDVPVVILSADATPGHMSRLLAKGARTYLTKPIDVGSLLAVLDELLGERGT